ncbi:serine/threonine-protein kinase PLK1-like [Amblyomma americanum]
MASAQTSDEFPGVVIDTNSQTEYTLGNFLGKLEQEINIHRTICHKHVVRFHGHFEDAKNAYIILELCTRQSLEEVRRWRRILPEFEVRYLMRQLLRACEYLVQEHVIHRDLKLGSLLLTEGSQLKARNFGLATRVHYEGQLKTSICGTTNYMAPEMLTKRATATRRTSVPSGASYTGRQAGCFLHTCLPHTEALSTAQDSTDRRHASQKNEG